MTGRRKLPPLATLRAFEAVARLGSVTRAAEELGRTHSAVSHQLRSLHDLAGCSFFDREGTGLRLNPQGEALQAVVSRSFDDLSQAWERILDDARAPGLHIACSATFAMRWLVPRLGAFYREAPETRIRLSMTSAREIRHQGADLLIAWDGAALPLADGRDSVALAPVRFGPVLSPGTPLEIAGDRLAFETRVSHEFTERTWKDWSRLTGVTPVWQSERHFPHSHLCIEAALAGLGVALVERRMVAGEIAAGRLIAPLGFAEFPDRLTALPVNERGQNHAARAFTDWLVGTLAAEDAAGQAETADSTACRNFPAQID